MKIKKIYIGVICILIFVIIICLITIFFKSDKFKTVHKGRVETVKNNVTNLNTLDENIILKNEVELAIIEKNDNEIEKNADFTNDIKNDNQQKNSNENDNIENIQSDINITSINKEELKEDIKIENNTKVEENSIVTNDNVQDNTVINENINIKNEVEIKDEQEQEIREEEKTEVTEELDSMNNIKSVAKEKLLNSIKYSSETYRKSGNEEYKFNKSEALRVANAIIDESFKYDKLWNGENLLYKIEFKYIEGIMQNSMYWPFRDTAIISSTKNKNTNGTFYIWAEDYIVNGEKVHTQYCIR